MVNRAPGGGFWLRIEGSSIRALMFAGESQDGGMVIAAVAVPFAVLADTVAE
jgi:hypothetical protein